MSTTTFAAVSALTALAPGRYGAVISDRWGIAGNPNGGYLLAMLARAAVDAGTHAHVVATSAHYLRPPSPGPVQIEAEVLRGGRSASQLAARLRQDGRTCVETLLTTADLSPDTKPYWDEGAPEARTAPWRRCVRVPAVTPAGLDVPIMEEAEARLDPATAEFMTGRPSGRGELRGWLALPDDEPFDAVSLLYAVDAFPPATFDVETTGWVPTLELTAYVRALPAPGPVQLHLRAHLVDAQRVDEQCTVWDATGRLVAQATQLAAIRLD